jgi:hypothetical protein
MFKSFKSQADIYYLFQGTRTYHKICMCIEDAGFEIRDQIQWLYGSGFPKSLNIGKAIDKTKRNRREIIGKKLLQVMKQIL